MEISKEELAPGFIAIRQGNKRILNINGYVSNDIVVNKFCSLGSIDCPFYNISFPVSVDGIGIDIVIINQSGNGNLYDSTLNNYIGGTVRGAVEYIAK